MESIELALRTWRPEGHPLYLDLHHPLGKLVAEWGELLNDYMNSLYKPDFVWEPLKELIDIWYYIRILAKITKVELVAYKIDSDLIDYLVSLAIEEANYQFKIFIIAGTTGSNFPAALNHCFSILSRICELTHLTVDQLTEASWEKLKPGSERGEEWTKAREA